MKLDIKPMFYYHTGLNLNYFVIPKCGSSSIMSAFGDSCIRTNIPLKGDVFTIYRDPFFRAHSAYAEVIRRKKWYNKFDERDLSFTNYLGILWKCGEWDRHQVSQSEYLEELEPVKLDVAFNLNDIPAIEALIGCKLPRENRTMKMPNTFTRLADVTPTEREIVEEIYKDDYKLKWF